jgi:hypothetical protein
MNRMRGMLEDEASMKKAKMMKEMQEENKRNVRLFELNFEGSSQEGQGRQVQKARTEPKRC